MTHQWFWVTRKTPPGGIIEPALIHQGKAWLTTWPKPLPTEGLQILGPCLPPEPQPLVRSVRFFPGYDNRAERGGGVHGLEIHFSLKGPHGLAFLEICSGWLPASVKGEGRSCPTCHSHYDAGWDIINHCAVHLGAYSSGLGVHSLVPLYEGHESHGPCGFLDGRPCFPSSSGLDGGPVFKALCTEGEVAVWKALEDLYERNLAHANPAASEI